MASSSKKKQRNQKKGKNKKSKKLLQDNDKILIAQFLEDNKHLAIASKTEAITTKGIIVQALGLDPGNKDLQNQLSQYLKSLGWEKSKYQKTINGERHYIWSNPSLSLDPPEVAQKKGVKQQSQTIDRQNLQSSTQPPNRINQSNKLNKGLSNSTNPCDSNDSSPTQPSKLEPQIVVEPLTKQSVPTCELKTAGKDEIANSIPQESLDKEKEIEEIAEILLLCPETFPELQDLYGSKVAKAACRLLPMETIDKIRESIEQRHKSIPRMKVVLPKKNQPIVGTKDIEVDRTALTCDVAGIPLEVGNIVKLYSESEIGTKSIGKIIEIKQQYQRIKVLVQWENGKQSEYFGEDRLKTTGSYFIDIKEIRKMICEDGKYYAATL